MRPITLFLVLLFIAEFSFSQNEYNKYILSSPEDAVTGIKEYKQSDIDGDGDLDLFILSSSGNSILWLENKEGRYLKIENSVISEVAIDFVIDAGDIDNDGSIDVVYTNSEDGDILWKSNVDGKGTFENEVRISSYDGEIENIFLVDLDLDNDLDVLYRIDDFDRISLRRNIDGTGQFGPEETIEFGGNIESIAMGDLNNDNYPDLAILRNNPSEVGYLINEGDSFGDKVLLSDAYDAIESIKIADINDDNYSDIIFSSEEDLAIYSFINSEGLVFQEFPLLENIPEFFNYEIGYINDDNLLDITIYETIWKFEWWKNTGDINNFEMNTTELEFQLYSGSKFSLDDFNGDGVEDLISTFTDKIRLNINNGEGVFDDPFSVTPYFNEDASFVRFVDIDNDDDLDIATNSGWMTNVGGTYTDLLENDLDGYRFEYADLDGDGFEDAVSMIGDTRLYQYKNHGGKKLEKVDELISFASNGIFDLELADWDSDGDIDVLTRANSHIYWFENDGLGNFAERQSLVSDCWCRFTVGDIDGDNDMDLLAGNKQTSKLAWYEQLEDGSISDQHNISDSNSGDRFLADIDGDGDLDAICQGFTSIEWHRSFGDGYFTPAKKINMAPYSFTDLHPMDMDYDGDMDIVYLSKAHDEIGWFEYVKDDAGFTKKHVITNEIGKGRSLDLADIDKDGIPDLVTVATEREQIELFTSIAYSNVMDGDIDLDLNGLDCQETDESMLFFITSGNVESIHSDVYLTKRDGSFGFVVPNGTYYSILTSNIPSNFKLKNDTIYSIFSEYGGEYSYSFCIESIEDKSNLGISMMPRDGFPVDDELSYIVHLQNTGNQIESGKVQLSYNSNFLQPLTSSLPFTIIEDGVLEFELESLSPLNYKAVDLNMSLIGTPKAGDLAFEALYLDTDDNEEDNYFQFYNEPTGTSPNSLLTLNADMIDWDNKEEYVYYMLRFQNTSTNQSPSMDMFGIINQNFDLSTLEILELSHDFDVSIIGRKLTVSYRDTLVAQPDNFDLNLESGGYVFFRLKPDTSIESGSDLNMSFNIDFNNGFIPIATSNKYLEDILNEKTIGYSGEKLNISPNPVYDFLEISIDNIDAYDEGKILDMNGSEVVHIENLKDRIDIKFLEQGLYILEVRSSKGIKTIQFVKI